MMDNSEQIASLLVGVGFDYPKHGYGIITHVSEQHIEAEFESGSRIFLRDAIPSLVSLPRSRKKKKKKMMMMMMMKMKTSSRTSVRLHTRTLSLSRIAAPAFLITTKCRNSEHL